MSSKKRNFQFFTEPKHATCSQQSAIGPCPSQMNTVHIHTHTMSMDIPYLKLSQNNGAQIFQTSRNHLKILGARKVTLGKFHAKDPQTLGVTIQNVVTLDLCTPVLHLYLPNGTFPSGFVMLKVMCIRVSHKKTIKNM